MTPQKYINTVLRIKARQAEYDCLNTSIADVQGPDFYAHLKPIDSYLLETVLDSLDDALFSMTDIKELASYYIYERMDVYKIKTHDQEYTWSTGEEFEKSVIQMIKDKNPHTCTDERTAMLECIAELAGSLGDLGPKLDAMHDEWCEALDLPPHQPTLEEIARAKTALNRAEQFLKGKPE